MPGESQKTSQPSREKVLAEAITKEEALLRDLELQRQQAEARLSQLKSSMTGPGSASSADLQILADTPTPATAAEKVPLFRSLFRGRRDVYPKLWVNTKLGKTGYSPACANEWVRGVCEKPRVKCGECPNQAFLSVSDHVISDHLRGRHVVGVYPLLEDETCWFLAVDLDGDCWKDDVAAIVETCHKMSIPAAVERSRSGNGAHIWFFFDAAIPASIARKMGCYLITDTMTRRHQLTAE
ncbi:MAG: hypothetical protein HY644_02330 [Acidobacteria bacterium]|nr:hypothetical protein [Acidobacteriota bacterium]